MPDYDLDDELHRLAASTRARVTPPAPQEIRMLGTRRHQRRVVMTTVTAVLAVVAVGGVAVGATRTTSGPTPPTSTTTPSPTAPVAPSTSPSPPTSPTATPRAGNELSDAVLITAQDVEGVTGLIRIPAGEYTAPPWRVVETGRGDKRLTPCQPAASAGPGREAAVHRRVRQVSSKPPGDGVGHLVEQRTTEAEAQTAYESALAWFTGCASRRVPGSTSTTRVFHQRELHGVDEGRVVDVLTGVTSPEGETLTTAAAVARVDRYVLVVTVDTWTTELSASREEVTALMAVAVAKLDGRKPAQVPDGAMVQADDVATLVSAKPAETTISPLVGFTERALWCDERGADPEETTPARADIAASRLVDHIDARGTKVQQTTIEYVSDGAASSAVQRLVPAASCARPLTLEAGDRAWAGRQSAGGTVEYGAMIQVGPAVAFVIVHTPETDIGEAKARVAFKAVERRMAAAYR